MALALTTIFASAQFMVVTTMTQPAEGEKWEMSNITDNIGVGGDAKVLDFTAAGDAITSGAFSVNIDGGFSGISTTTPSGKVVDLGVQFTSGLAGPEINKRTGEIIYLDNRPSITRNERQKEDIKIVLEF